jgi:integrase
MASSDSTTKPAKARNKVNFTAGRVAAFKCPDGKKEAFLWDDKQPGLGLRAFASGKKTYIFQVWVNGRTQRAVIGAEESFDIEQARTEAKKFNVLASQNVSPAKVKREKAATELSEEKEIKRGSVTLGAVWSEYVEASKKDWGEKHYRDHLKSVQQAGLPWARGKGLLTKQGCLFPLVNIKLGELSADLIRRWLDKENKTRPGVAAQTYRLLFACLTWCNEQLEYAGLIDVVALKSKSVKKAVVKLKPKDDVLQREQLCDFFKHIRAINNPVISAFIQTLLLTGARRNELTGLKWNDVDFQWHSMSIRDKATTRGQVEGLRVIPLTPYIASLLMHLPRRNEWVFSSLNGASGKLVDPRKSYNPALIAANIEGLTLHGLRRSFATLSEWVEVPTGVVAQIMGHKPSATAEKHYKKRPLDLLRLWHERIETWVLEQAGLCVPVNSEKRLTVVKEA